MIVLPDVRIAALCVLTVLMAACRPAAPEAGAPGGDTPVASAAEPASSAAPVASPSEMLARVPADRLDVGTPEASEYLDRFFKDGCREGDERLSFDRICLHESAGGDDPSPWPDLVLGIEAGRIASAVLTRSAQSLGTGWTCMPAEGLDGMRFCYVDATTTDERARWSAEWTAFFSAGD